MPPTSRRPTSKKEPQAPDGAEPAAPVPAPHDESARQERLASSAKPVPEETEPATVVLRLPFLTVSMSRPALHRADPAGSPGRPVESAAHSAAGSSGVQRLMFYGGVAALGVAGAVDWPVAAAIAAGTYIATRTRGTGAARTG